MASVARGGYSGISEYLWGVFSTNSFSLVDNGQRRLPGTSVPKEKGEMAHIRMGYPFGGILYKSHRDPSASPNNGNEVPVLEY